MPTFKIPKTFGACADRLYELKQLGSPLRRQLEALDAERKAITDHVIKTMSKTEGGGVGKVAQVEVVVKAEPSVKDREALLKHIIKTGAWDLLQGKLASAAVKERWEAGKAVPGVESFNVVTVSVTKR